MTEQQSLAAVRQLLQRAQRVCVLTGAGMSAESGIPTFRDAMSGLWARFDPAELGSETGFRADPERVWAWYSERRLAMVAAQPNAGHRALSDFARRHPGRLTLVSQNVDDLHQRAGNADTLRLHGDILREQWLSACPLGRRCDPSAAVPGTPPRCADCGNLVRPGVVWFGEMLPASTLAAAEQAAQDCQLMLVVGTSGAVWPAAGLAGLAREAGARVVVLNPQPSELDPVAHWVLRGTAAALLPVLLDAG